MNGECELFIYRNCKILKNKNFKVDDIHTYLSTLDTLNKVEDDTPVAIKGQWMKHQLKTKYVIDVSQTQFANYNADRAKRVQDLTSYESLFNFNYLSAQNIDHYQVVPAQRTFRTRRVYYFITGKRWMSESAIELELEMDVINTLIDNYASGEPHLDLSDKTTILRQHKDRWERGDEPNRYIPLIDLYSENITPLLYKTKEDVLYEYLSDKDDVDDGNYYVIFKSRSTDDNSPIDVFMCCDSPYGVEFSASGYSGDVNCASELKVSGVLYSVIYGADTGNVGCSITFKVYTSRTEYEEHTLTINSSSQAIIIGPKFIIKVSVDANNHMTTISSFEYSAWVNKKFENVYVQNLKATRLIQKSDFGTGYLINTTSNSFPTLTNGVWKSISDIERTDPLLLKIIAVPYRIANFSINNNGNLESIPEGWAFDQPNGLLKYVSANLTKPFIHEIISFENENLDLEEPTKALEQRTISVFRTKIQKNSVYETKLLHSDFYLSKFVYDSFVYDFKGEFIGGVDGPTSLSAEFSLTSTMNSKMMFNFYSLQLIHSIENYPRICYVARNNELPVFNSAYINYIKTGFNYDVKTKNRQLANNIVSGVAQTVGAIAGAVVGGPIGVAGAIGLGIGAFTKFYNAVSQTAQAEQNIAQKLKSSEMQGLSVIGSDDVDLMISYTDGNKAKLCRYEISEKMKKCLFDLFHYCGYVANFQGIPDTSSRMWFNFVMAEPVYKNEQNFPQELIEELSKKYREGITFLHNVSNEWDFEQQYENWELI